MLKTISAALLAVSVLAAPAMAAGPRQNAHAPAIKAVQVKTSVLNANAKMGRHHHRHHRPQAAWRAQDAAFSKVTIKHVSRHQARLKLIRGERLDPHCPRRASRISAGPCAIASPMAAGRSCFVHVSEMRIPFGARTV